MKTEDTSPAPNDAKPKYPRIEVRSYEIASVVGLPAAHNEILFMIDEKTQLALHGMAFDRYSGNPKPAPLAGFNTLQVVGSKSFSDKGMKLLGSATIFEGDLSEMYELLGRAAEAGNYINKKNLDYVVIGSPFGHAQNSNSVASTLIKAMGLTYPPEIENIWAPGHERTLIPNNWKSEFEGTATTFFDKENHAIRDRCFALMDKLGVSNVRANVLSLPKPDVAPDAEITGGYKPTFYDPNAASENSSNSPKQNPQKIKQLDAQPS